MSLQDFFMMRAAQEHQNMLNSDNAGIILQSLAQGVAKGLEEQQIAMREQRKADEQQKKAMEQFSALEKSGYKIKRKITSSDGKINISAEAIDPTEEKDNEVLRDIQRENMIVRQKENLRRTIDSRGATIDPNNLGEYEGVETPENINQLVSMGMAESLPDGKVNIYPKTIRDQIANNFVPNNSVVEQISAYTTVKKNLSDVAKMYKDLGIQNDKNAMDIIGQVFSDASPLSVQAKSNLLRQLGNNPKYAALSNKLGILATSYVFAMSGKAVTDKERQMFMNIMPSLAQRPEFFAENAKMFSDTIDNEIVSRINNLASTKANHQILKDIARNAGIDWESGIGRPISVDLGGVSVGASSDSVNKYKSKYGLE